MKVAMVGRIHTLRAWEHFTHIPHNINQLIMNEIVPFIAFVRRLLFYSILFLYFNNSKNNLLRQCTEDL
jgi:hypothetical protein